MYTSDYLEAGSTVNSEQYIEALKHLERHVCHVRQSTEPTILQHDNARPHTLRATTKSLVKLKSEPIPYPLHKNWCPVIFHYFLQLKKESFHCNSVIKGIHFTMDDELKDTVRSWFKERSPAFFIDGMRKLVHHWDKCVAVNCDYMEK